MKAFEYDRYGLFTGREFEVEPEFWANGCTVWKLPAFSTSLAPPEQTDDGEVAVFIPSKWQWVLLPDHRGETWFDWRGRPMLIERPGDPADWKLHKELWSHAAG